MDNHVVELHNEPESLILGFSNCTIQCIGQSYVDFLRSKPGTSAEAFLTYLEVKEEENDTDSKFDEEDMCFLRSLDPKEWKDQDHYAVLGLKTLRYKATDDDIKKAYRLKVLRHHPDKRKALGEEIRPDDDYFTCITKAWEMLGNPRNRRSYDSIDPEFNNQIPSGDLKEDFFLTFKEAFKLNSRWSEKKPVPQLGNPDSPRGKVEQFYSFWYNFESWREFSYLDEEEKEKGQVREERRWIEKQNKATRGKRKKEEMTRIRSLVDTAYVLDPRIQKFKIEDKNRKLAAKEAKKVAARARQEEEEKRLQAEEEDARRAKEEAEALEKARQNAIRAEREAQKKALKKEKSALRKLAKANDYYSNNDEEMLRHMSSLEVICESLQVEELIELVNNLQLNGREVYREAIEKADQHIERERQALMDSAKRTSCGNYDSRRTKGGMSPWSSEHLQLLIKAVNVFPAGTSQRWEVVAKFINQHATGDTVTRTAKDALAKAKDLQSSDYSKSILKIAVNQEAYDQFEKVQKNTLEVGAAASQRFESPAEMQGMNLTPWTAGEQQLLEQALKSYPASTDERWDKIAECIPSRTKKDCMKRYKVLAEMVKAKKAVQAAALTQHKPK